MRCSRGICKNASNFCSDFSGYVVVANYGFLIIELGINQKWQHCRVELASRVSQVRDVMFYDLQSSGACYGIQLHLVWWRFELRILRTE